MANTLLSDAVLLSIRFDGTIVLPEKSRSKAPAVKTITDILRYGDAEVLFAGAESAYPTENPEFAPGKTVARIHVIDAPSPIDCDSPKPMLTNWFLRQLRSNRKHIVLMETVQKDGQQFTIVDVYVRGIAVPIREINVRSLHYHANNMNYAV